MTLISLSAMDSLTFCFCLEEDWEELVSVVVVSEVVSVVDSDCSCLIVAFEDSSVVSSSVVVVVGSSVLVSWSDMF